MHTNLQKMKRFQKTKSSVFRIQRNIKFGQNFRTGQETIQRALKSTKLTFKSLSPQIGKFFLTISQIYCPRVGSSQDSDLKSPGGSEYWNNWRASELVSTFVYRGSSHRRKSAKFDMVWLYGSPIPVGRRGEITSFKWFLPAFRGVGVGSAPCDTNPYININRKWKHWHRTCLLFSPG